MKGIEELAKRELGEVWMWEKELDEFLDIWSKDNLAYVHSLDVDVI